jgi:O-antigen ligase
MWALAAVIALAPAYLVRFHIYNYPTTLLEVLIVVFLLGTVLRLEIKDFRKLKKLGRINWAIALFVLAGVISVFFSPEKARAIGQLKAYIIEPLLVFYLSLITIKNRNQTEIVIKSLFWVAVLISTFGIFQHYSFIFLPLRFWGTGAEMARIVSIFEYPNALSLYLAPLLGLFTTLWFYDYPLTKKRWVSAIGLFLIGTALILTFSRGAWIATTIGIMFIVIRRFEFKKVALPIIIAGILLLLLPGIRNRLSLGVSDASSSAHFDLLKIGLNKLIDNPIFGNGLYGFRGTQIEQGYNGEILNYPHNIVMNFWLELGILGLIGFIWIIFLSFRQKKETAIAIAAGVYLLIMLVHGLVDVPYFKNDLAILFWFAISLIYIKN